MTMPGQRVAYAGRAWSCNGVTNDAISGPGGIPDPCFMSHLVHADGTSKYVRTYTRAQAARHNLPPSPELPLLPACDVCAAAKAWPCVADCTRGSDARAVAVLMTQESSDDRP